MAQKRVLEEQKLKRHKPNKPTLESTDKELIHPLLGLQQQVGNASVARMLEQNDPEKLLIEKNVHTEITPAANPQPLATMVPARAGETKIVQRGWLEDAYNWVADTLGATGLKADLLTAAKETGQVGQGASRLGQIAQGSKVSGLLKLAGKIFPPIGLATGAYGLHSAKKGLKSPVGEVRAKSSADLLFNLLGTISGAMGTAGVIAKGLPKAILGLAKPFTTSKEFFQLARWVVSTFGRRSMIGMLLGRIASIPQLASVYGAAAGGYALGTLTDKLSGLVFGAIGKFATGANYDLSLSGMLSHLYGAQIEGAGNIYSWIKRVVTGKKSTSKLPWGYRLAQWIDKKF